MWNEEDILIEEIQLLEEKKYCQGGEGFLTPEETEEIIILHAEAMQPTQEEDDWMLTVAIKKEQKDLADLYWPDLANYKIEDSCEICKRLFL